MKHGTGPTDAAIIAESLIDPERFEVVFERHFDAVVRFASGRVGLVHAGDIAGEAFARAFRLRGRFDQNHANALPWLFGIAANVCREHLRKTSRGRRASNRVVHVTDRGGHGFELEATERVDALAQRSDILDALSRLSEDEYAVLSLVALAGYSYQEVANSLGIPIGTVRSRLARARRRVKELLEGDRPIQPGVGSHESDAVERVL